MISESWMKRWDIIDKEEQEEKERYWDKIVGISAHYSMKLLEKKIS
jgi:hypothetical protein